MRTLKLHFPDDALPTLDTFLKQTKEARVFRRAQAVRNVVKGQRLQTVSDALQFTYSALRTYTRCSRATNRISATACCAGFIPCFGSCCPIR